MWPAVAVGVTAWFRACWSGADHEQEISDVDRVVQPAPAAVRALAGAPAGPADRSIWAAPQVWAKREDCNSGIAYGGNKTRKLEYLVADALAQGCDTLVSIGGVQSNHTRQVAAVAAQLA